MSSYSRTALNKYRLNILKKLCKEGLLSIDCVDPKDNDFAEFVKEFQMPKAPTKDCGAKPPPKGRTGYILFGIDIRKMNPKSKINSKEHSRRWKALTEDEREEYNEKSRDEKAIRNARIEKFKKGEDYTEDENSETESEDPKPKKKSTNWGSDSDNESNEDKKPVAKKPGRKSKK